ncbi:hypothetical protein RM717_32320 [Streptomyces griseus]|uniref:CARDB domain-containing protein n=1 Tax=Streptomyces stephensoniae TaxID=3375367 RepID=A0ABU2WBC0_9ACTN|nr:hypothetical protein [Streptomyces griseus]MDT0495184.1 hypothetical protein [Streptomyces griseus]
MPLSAVAAMAAAMTVLAGAVMPAAGVPVTAGEGGGAAAAAAAAPVPEAVPLLEAVPLPEADLSHHGHVSLWGDRIAIRIRSENRGPSDVPASTVRLRFSEPLAPRQELPYGCLRSGGAAVLCETGGLRSRGGARQTALDLKLASSPDEVVVRLDTVWNGGVRDTNPKNDAHEVLAPSTGDAYAF